MCGDLVDEDYVDGPLECALTFGQVAKETVFMAHQLQRDGKSEWANIHSDLAASQGLTQLSRAEAIQAAQKGFDDRTRLKPNGQP